MRWKPTILLAVALAVFNHSDNSIFGQEVKELAGLDLQELANIPIVSAARHEQNRFDSPRSVSVVSGEEIRRRNFRNVPEAVASVTGVFLQQTNYGGGSPIIRGMVGNRILLMVNGIRLNNGTYRLGPNQYLNFIDINRVERIEVIRGGGSALYGSDAFGGVINVITKTAPDPRLGAEFSGSAHVRFATAEQSGAGRIELSGAQGPVSILSGFTDESFGDLRGGNTTGVQPYTGYSQIASDLTVNYALAPNKNLVAGLGRLKQLHVPRTDLLRAGSDLEYLWTAEGRDFGYVQYSQTPASEYLGALQITLAFQRPFEDISRIIASDRETERFLRDSVRTFNAGVQLSTSIGAAHLLTYGVETTIDRISSGRTDLNLQTKLFSTKTGSYPDQSSFGSFSVFVQDEVQLTNRVGVVLGVRHDRFAAHSKVKDPLIGALAVDTNPTAVSGSGQFLVKATKQISLFGGISQGFRAPTIDDTSIIGGSGSRFEIPNGQLKPEKSISLEYGVRLRGRIGQLSLVGFDDYYRDLVDRAAATLSGLSFVDSNRNGIKDNQEYDVWQRQNINRARIRGFEFESIFTAAEGWTWTSTITATRGTDVTQAVPLTKIPPVNGNSRITWQVNRTVWIEGALVAASGQHRLAPADKTDVRIGPGGTAGFAVVHLRAGFNGSSPLAGFSVALENVTNARYRLHGSGLDRPGANLIFGYMRHF